jgi:hypothetical protein
MQNPAIGFANRSRGFKSGRLDVKVEHKVGQFLQVDREFGVVPRRPIGQLVVSQHVRLGLGQRQVVKQDDRDLVKSKQLRRFIPAVARDNLVVLVD